MRGIVSVCSLACIHRHFASTSLEEVLSILVEGGEGKEERVGKVV